MKKVITICLLLASFLTGITTDAQNKINRNKGKAKTSSSKTNFNKDVSKKDQMLKILKKYNTHPYNSYFITDLNYDGLPELWILDQKNANDSGHGGSTLRVFSFVNGIMTQDAMKPDGWGVEPFMINNKLYLYEGIQIWEQVENISLEDGKIKQTLMYEGTMNDEGEIEISRGSMKNKRFIEDHQDDAGRDVTQSPLKNSSLLLQYF